MENASKALLMAAGILMGVLILTVVIVLFTTFGDLGREYNEKLELQSIIQFNTQFTKYEDTTLRAQDVQTLANLVNKWNNTGTNETIEMTVKINGHQYNYDDIDYDFLYKRNNEIIYNDTDNTINYPTFTIEITDYYSSGRVKIININKN